MFPPLTTGYEERDGSIGERSLAFYERLAKGGTAFVVIGDVAPVMTASPTPKLCDDRQIPAFKRLADTLHKYDCKVALQIFHPEYDVPEVGRLIRAAQMAAQAGMAAKAQGDMATFGAKMKESQEFGKQAHGKIAYDMQHFIQEVTPAQLAQIKGYIADASRRAQEAGIDAIQNRRYITCVLNAENGEEATMSIKPGVGQKKVVVVGGGVAGLEAARVAALRGYTVDLYEKEAVLGGQINIAAVPPRKDELLRSVAYFECILPALGVNILLNTEATKEIMNAADAVIVAVGAHDFVLPIPGVNGANVVSSWDVLAGKAEVKGNCAVIGGGLVGTETAEYLLEKGCSVSIIEMMDKIANGESSTILPTIMADFKAHNVQQYVNTKVSAIEPDCVKAMQGEEEISIPCDMVVMAVGSKKNVLDVEGVTVPVYYAGDCSGERTASICEAIRGGYKAANEI